MPGSKLHILGMVIPPSIGNPYNKYINPYWVDEFIPYSMDLMAVSTPALIDTLGKFHHPSMPDQGTPKSALGIRPTEKVWRFLGHSVFQNVVKNVCGISDTTWGDACKNMVLYTPPPNL